MSESLLTILKFFLLALLYLFFFRVLRAVWAEVHARPVTASPEAPSRVAGRARKATGTGPARLKLLEPANLRGRVYDLPTEATIGRSPGCQVAVDDSTVSQLHARIFRKEDQLFIEDLGSKNGTYLNRKRVTGATPVRRGDRIQVGKHVLEVTR